MKAILLLVALCALAAADHPTYKKYVPKKYKIDDKVVLERQLMIFDLLKELNNPIDSDFIVDLAHKFNPENYAAEYMKYWNEFAHYNEFDPIPKEEIYSEVNPKNLKHTIPLFKLFYYADWQYVPYLFGWAKMHVNPGLLGYSFMVALIHRPDLPPIILPALYELYPNYFYSSDVLFQGDIHKNNPQWMTTANYTENHVYFNSEQHLSYFTEDVGLNSYFAYINLFYPSWMDGKEFKISEDRRGELFYAFYQMLYARYYSERLSHDYSPLPPIKYGEHFGPYYAPLVYENGIHFPSRHGEAHTEWDYHYDYYNFTDVIVYDSIRRIHDAVQLGFAYDNHGGKVPLYGEHGIETFANMLQGNHDSPFNHYYGYIPMYIRYILGYGPQPYKPVPSVVEHCTTALRDPAYWQYVKWIVDFFQFYKENSPHKYYTKDELYFPGVKVESIKVDRLTTYFEYFFSDLSYYYNHSYHHDEYPSYNLVRQLRLKHKPFTYTINVESTKPQPSIVRVYIGPKYDEFGHEMNITNNRMHFYLIDKFYYELQAGKNAILRNSEQTMSIGDRTPFWKLYKGIKEAIKGNGEFVVDGSETYFGLPNRLVLPSGKPGGMPYQFYAIATPYHETEHSHEVPKEQYYYKVGTGGWWYWMDDLPFGFPFDKPIDPSVFYVPNSHFEDVTIYHKKFEELNVAAHQD